MFSVSTFHSTARCDPLLGVDAWEREFVDKVSLIYGFALVEFPSLDCALSCCWARADKDTSVNELVVVLKYFCGRFMLLLGSDSREMTGKEGTDRWAMI